MAPTSSSSVFSSSLFNSSSVSVTRPTTRDSTLDPHNQAAGNNAAPSGTPAVKERKTGFSRKASRRGTWTGAASQGAAANNTGSNGSNGGNGNGNGNGNDNNNTSSAAVTDASAPPALPEYALAAAAKVVIREKDKIKEKLREREKEKEQKEREKEREREREKEHKEREKEQREREKEKSREREKDRDRDKRRDRERDIRPRDTIIAGAADGAHAPGSPKEPHNFVLARLHAAAMGTPGPGYGPGAGGSSLTVGGSVWETSMHMESSLVFHEITELAQKRISTLTYLRKAHEGRIYWFNTYLFDRPDYSRMPSFDPRKLGRKATSYFLLGISIPTINDLYSSTPVEFLRCLNGLLAEFDTFTQLHGDGPPSAASLTRARLPSMFRRPVAKTRRSGSTSAAASDNIIEEGFGSGGGNTNQNSKDRDGGGGGGGGGGGQSAVMNFATAESELLPGEEYAYLLTPSLPFDPDFYETFATLCDVLIDCYTRFLALIPTQWDATPHIAELFTKADGKMRKIMVQGIVRDFEEHSRTNVKTEMAGISKVVLAGLV